MWNFIGWLLLFIVLLSVEEKIDNLCAHQGIVCDVGHQQ